MRKKTQEIAVASDSQVNEGLLFARVAEIIENRKYRAVTHANQETTMMFWEVGQHINSVVLANERAAYGRKILTALAAKLVARYGNSFTERNLYRMTLLQSGFLMPRFCRRWRQN
jgi:hypothetical protein